MFRIVNNIQNIRFCLRNQKNFFSDNSKIASIPQVQNKTSVLSNWKILCETARSHNAIFERDGSRLSGRLATKINESKNDKGVKKLLELNPNVLESYMESCFLVKDDKAGINIFHLVTGRYHIRLSAIKIFLKYTTGSETHFFNVWNSALSIHPLDDDLLLYGILFLGQHSGARANKIKDDIYKGIKVNQMNSIYEKSFSNNRIHFERGLSTLQLSLQPFHKRTFKYDVPLLKSLNKRNTSELQSQLPSHVHKSSIVKKLDRQLSDEKRGYITVDSIFRQSEQSKVNCQKVLELQKKLCINWKANIVKSMESSSLFSKNTFGNNLNQSKIASFFKLMPFTEYAEIVVDEIVHSICSDSETYCPSTISLQYQIGNLIFNRFKMNYFLDKERFNSLSQIYNEYLDWFLAPKHSSFWNHREAFIGLCDKYNKSLDNEIVEWPSQVLFLIGAEMLKHILSSVVISLDSAGRVVHDDFAFSFKGDLTIEKYSEDKVSLCPALYKIYRQRSLKFLHELKPHPCIARLFSYTKLSAIRFNCTHVPMVVPPLPWISSRRGGYILNESPFLRLWSENKGGISSQEEKDLKNNVATPVLDSLNILSSTPWIVNESLLDVALSLFNTNDEKYNRLLSKLDIPRHADTLESPPDLDSSIVAKLKNKISLTKNEIYECSKASTNKQIFFQLKGETYALWCTTLYKLSLANHYRKDILYFPHNIDFRGRVYPIPPHLNHMGADMARSLLVFAKGQKLGKDGLKWLKLHIVNLSGNKKRCSLEERLEYAEQLIPEILDSAENPLHGRMWWTTSDDPWQTLAVCLEIKKALSSPDIENVYSHIPIHQDGSCNGLQHYAALGRDVLGAASVNLIPSTVPQDVYSEIVSLVEKRRKEDERNGHSIALSLEGFIQRKVIKQTVMTTVYGVTKYGAKFQVLKQLKNLEDFPVEKADEAAKYIVSLTFESLNELFTASQEIQSWLTQSAIAISKNFNELVSWTTPLGLKVIQPYKKMKTFRNNLWTQGESNKLHSNTIKQRNGFPPNFIHSLDSSHMMMTSLVLWNLGVTYASVHDCYWTHPSTVELMNVACRNQFIKLHSEPILENLSESFVEKYIRQNSEDKGLEVVRSAMLFQNIPRKSSLDLNVVKDSVFFFS